MSVLFFILSLSLLWDCPMHAWFKTQPDIWVGFRHRIWGFSLLAVSIIEFLPHFPEAGGELKPVLWFCTPERFGASYWSVSYHSVKAACVQGKSCKMTIRFFQVSTSLQNLLSFVRFPVISGKIFFFHWEFLLVTYGKVGSSWSLLAHNRNEPLFCLTRGKTNAQRGEVIFPIVRGDSILSKG